MEWRPTHSIDLDSGERVEVMLLDGAAYTRSEWDTETPADYECDPVTGAWTFLGRAFPGTIYPK